MRLRKPQRLSAYRMRLLDVKIHARHMRAGGMSYAQIGRQLGRHSKTGTFARSTVHGWINPKKKIEVQS